MTGVDTAPLAIRLLDSAIEQFGQAGFEGASTRQIAAAAGTPMSSITYHFGGKQGLYLACAEHIASQISDVHAQNLGVISSNPPRSAEEARRHIDAMLESFARLMLSPRSEAWSQFIVREQQRPTEAFEILYTRIMKPMLETAVDLLAIARPSLPEAARRELVINIIGMVLVLRLGRACVCRIMQVGDVDGPTAESLVAGLLRSARSLTTEE